MSFEFSTFKQPLSISHPSIKEPVCTRDGKLSLLCNNQGEKSTWHVEKRPDFKVVFKIYFFKYQALHSEIKAKAIP